MAYITLNKNNFFNNLDIIANRTKSVDKIALVLKDNAYGHGLLEMATLAKEYGVKKAVVRTCKEAQKVESFFEYILVLADNTTCENEKIRYTINDIKSIKEFPKGTKVELKVDTGMHRNGIAMDELEAAFLKIKEAELLLEAVFTHHRSADEFTSEWFWQRENFKKVKEKSRVLAKEFGFSELRFHSSNSAALFRWTNFDEDMARVGIAAYGCMKLPNALHVEKFKPVLSLWANRISSREVKQGHRVGYGGDFEAKEECVCVISNYNFGYGDGFLRACANGYKTPHGIELSGRISMDNSSFVSDKDEILVFNDAREAASYAKTISYEVLTSLKADLNREIV
ncbi:MAG: alanine racemase [Sulfurimonas sp. RIFOXYD12_FULL_33_39]|uniref:alanine racemase n=1 Tax=unclassified Sulfurimonas TaxID=2623549 RepID=UPI0008D4B9AF|nr:MULTISPECIES: alanine racemase [unclassified Sulfurimonas]OHE06640.1 MAG: alanine racemase [Sulfurimonas sp. RIFCSPLOWO2_12_FULL_34_6]OHE10459.1 MAG: alanine racemase [Sulfurimonas sp. RIFOXYD12_FULL_33_39]OHE14918.1 MAG: alanine racemase [Sulfurimonas sp. RIFOXYD2_FULL_34_21]